MQVKKFEAKTMKEALELVKKHLGPEAIILSAKDNGRGFGLVGHKSVEVTAAVSEQTLKRKQLAESKLHKETKIIYDKSAAKKQKEFIDKSTSAWHEPRVSQVSSLRYVDIPDEENLIEELGQGSSLSEVRVKSAAQRAWQAMNEAAVTGSSSVGKTEPILSTSTSLAQDQEIRSLRAEIQHLRSLLDGFQKIPQTFVKMHPGAESGIPFELSGVYQKLLNVGLSVENTVKVLKLVPANFPSEQLKKIAFVEAWLAQYFMNQTTIVTRRAQERFHAFIGPAGQGKTSALVKFASSLVIHDKKRVAIVTTDLQKVGAAEQLRIYAKILNVPFAVIHKPSDWTELQSDLSQVDYVFIDFPGMNLKSHQESDFIRQLLPQFSGGLSLHYVLSVLGQDESVFEIAHRYQEVGFTDVIFTGLDEAAQHGLIYNFQRRFPVPLHSFGIGRQIPEDLEPATKERLVDLLFKLSKIKRG